MEVENSAELYRHRPYVSAHADCTYESVVCLSILVCVRAYAIREKIYAAAAASATAALLRCMSMYIVNIHIFGIAFGCCAFSFAYISFTLIAIIWPSVWFRFLRKMCIRFFCVQCSSIHCFFFFFFCSFVSGCVVRVRIRRRTKSEIRNHTATAAVVCDGDGRKH